MKAHEIAKDFVNRYERFWREGATDVTSVYTENAILCSYEIVRGRQSIAALLQGIVAQGWTEIGIEVVETSADPVGLLLACRYTAKSLNNEMTAKSSYVLSEEDGTFKAAMHTAT